MKPKIPGQKPGRVKELIAEFEAKSKSGAGLALGGSPADTPEIKKGHVSDARTKLSGKVPFAADSVSHKAPPEIPRRTPSEVSERGADGLVDVVEISEELSVIDAGTNGGADAALAGLKKPEGDLNPHKATQSTQTPEETGIATQTSEEVSTQTPEGVSTQTDPMTPEIDIENKPLKGLEKLKACFVGEAGIKAGFLKLKDGDVAAGLRDMVTSLVMAPIHLVTMVFDGPRKIGDLASIEGQKLINSSRGDFKGWAGAKAVGKHLAGGLLQLVGGAARLAIPVGGWVAGLALTYPVGWAVGGALLGLYLLKELAAIANDGLGDMQTVRAGRDLVSGGTGVLGAAVEAIVKPIQFAVHRARRTPAASENVAEDSSESVSSSDEEDAGAVRSRGASSSSSVDGDSSDSVSLSDEEDAELAAELAEMERVEMEAAKAEREEEVRDSMPDASGLSVAERIARFERGAIPEDDE